MLTTYRSCKRRFYHLYVQRIKPIGESIHLIAGGAFAAGLEAARNAQARTKHPLTADELALAAFPAFTRRWGTFVADETETKNFHNTFHALEAYLAEFHPYHDAIQPVRRTNGDAATEFNFAIPLPVQHPSGDPFIFVGRFDLLGSFNGLPVVVDEKTTSALGPFWLRQWDMRGQFLGYMWACKQLGYAVDHVVVRGIAIQKTQHQFATVPVQYPQTLIDRWYFELLNTLHSIVADFESGYWAYNFGDACSSYGGCSFSDLCRAANPDNWMNNYEPNLWTPVNSDAAG